MSRSPEQRKVENDLAEAIQAFLDATDAIDREGGEEISPPGVMTHWVVYTARTNVDDDGESYTTTNRVVPETMALWQVIGLTRAELKRVETEYITLEDD